MAANVTNICASFKAEQYAGIHAFTAPPVRATATPDVIMAALYQSGSSLGSGTTTYSTTGELVSAGYTAGGQATTWGTAAAITNTTAYITPTANLTWTGITVSSVDTVLLYNQTQGNRAILVLNFGAVTFSSGTLTLTMPVNASATALLYTN